MTTTCPKCGSENLSIAIACCNGKQVLGGYGCRDCATLFTDWQQSIIEQQQQTIADNDVAFEAAQEIIRNQEQTIEQQREDIEITKQAHIIDLDALQYSYNKVKRLNREIERFKTMSTVEIMCENESVRAHVTEWENRCLKAETKIAHLLSLLKEIEEHPHCDVKNIAGDICDDLGATTPLHRAPIRVGIAYGHRAAAEIAKRARK
jgi:hypothetical protein